MSRKEMSASTEKYAGGGCLLVKKDMLGGCLLVEKYSLRGVCW